LLLAGCGGSSDTLGEEKYSTASPARSVETGSRPCPPGTNLAFAAVETARLADRVTDTLTLRCAQGRLAAIPPSSQNASVNELWL